MEEFQAPFAIFSRRQSSTDAVKKKKSWIKSCYAFDSCLKQSLAQPTRVVRCDCDAFICMNISCRDTLVSEFQRHCMYFISLEEGILSFFFFFEVSILSYYLFGKLLLPNKRIGLEQINSKKLILHATKCKWHSKLQKLINMKTRFEIWYLIVVNKEVFRHNKSQHKR